MKLLPALLLFTLQSFATGPDPSTNCGAYPPPSQGTYYTKCELNEHGGSQICGSVIIKDNAKVDTILQGLYVENGDTLQRTRTFYLANSDELIIYDTLVNPYSVHLLSLNNCDNPDTVPLPKFDSTFFVLPDSIFIKTGDTVYFSGYETSYQPKYMSLSFNVSYYTTHPNYSISVNGTTYLPTVISSSPKRMQNSLRSTKHPIRFYNLLGQKRLKAD